VERASLDSMDDRPRNLQLVLRRLLRLDAMKTHRSTRLGSAQLGVLCVSALSFSFTSRLKKGKFAESESSCSNH
jgi:hypothetical protein